MASYNKVILAGNLTADPEKRYVPSGTAVAELRVAINERFKNRDGELKESTVYVDVDTWDRQAETCAQYLSKGSPVLIEGRLKLDQWETKEGEKRSRLRVRADRVQFLSGTSGTTREHSPPPSRSAAPSENPGEGSPPPSKTELQRDSGTENDDDNLPF